MSGVVKHTPSAHVEFGWGAPSMKEQHPILPDFEADQFDKDNAALIRLSVRGYLTGAQKLGAMKKITASIGKEIRSALLAKGGKDHA